MRPLMALTVLSACVQVVQAAEPGQPVAGQDYYSWQIVSGNPKSLEKLYRQYSALPYVRIERRGEQYVLRAGFWPSSQAARDALSAQIGKDAFIRIAAYRPEAIVRRNWGDQPQPQERPPQTARPAVPATPVALEEGNLKPFNAADYALAFDVFMGAGDAERAFQLARKAVASLPLDTDWRRKLARLSDWTQRPLLAWEHWAYLFQRGDRSEETVTAVLRLAAQAEQPELAIAAWKQRAARAEPLADQWDELYQLYDIAGKEKEGSQYFEQQYRRRLTPRLLEQSAQMAVNAGDDERALRLYTERAQAKPFSMDATLHSVIAMIRQDRMREAYTLMQAVSSEVSGEAEEFWRILGNVAWELHETAGAEKAYQQIAGSPKATAGDWSRLIYLVRQRHPTQGADLALEAYRRFGNADNLLLALEIYVQESDQAGQTRIFKQIAPADSVQLEANTRFLVLRAQYHQRQSEMDSAWQDLRRALEASPGDAQVALPALWFLIDTGRKAELAALLQALASSAQTDPAYWLPFAAAHHALERFREALVWYRKQAQRNPDDALLLLNYAEVLERVDSPGMASRVRRHAWLKLREKHPAPELKAPLDTRAELLALARLAMLNQPGDPAQALVRQMASQLRALPQEQAQTQTRQTRDLILGWAIAKEQFHNARRWMWQNYARQAGQDDAAPLWGESQTALQLNDTPTLERLLSQQADKLPVHNRYDTAYTLAHWPQALDIGFQGMQKNDLDEPLHDRYRQHAPLHAHYVQLRFSKEMLGVLDASSQQLEARLVLEPKWHLMLGWSHKLQSSADPAIGPFVPGVEQLSSMGLRFLGSHGETRVSVFQRQEQTHHLGLSLAQNWRWGQRLVLDGSLGLGVDSSDSLPLRVGGYEDQLRLGFHYAISRREYLRYGTRLSHFHTRWGDALGSGLGHELELGYRIRTEYPDFRLRAFANQQSYNHSDSVSAQTLGRLAEVQADIASGRLDAVKYFLPEGSTTLGACLGMGENLAGQSVQEVYTRALRPFFDACSTSNSLNGAGYSGMIGLAGTLTGEDHLSLRLEQSSGGSGSGAMTRVLGLRYRHYF